MFITRQKVIEILEHPEWRDYSRNPLIIAQGTLNQSHVIRIVYRIEQNKIESVEKYTHRCHSEWSRGIYWKELLIFIADPSTEFILSEVEWTRDDNSFLYTLKLLLLLFIPEGDHNMKKTKTQKISYEQEADILRVEILTSPIDYATEIGSFIVHFNKKGIPVYVEILEASKFLKETEKAYLKGRTVRLSKMQYV